MSRGSSLDASNVVRDASAGDGVRLCAWCGDPIPERARRDSKFCRQSCRQASHRFVSRQRATSPLRLAYADPPYPGLAARYARGELELDVRVGSWHRGARPGVSAWPRAAWEPVVYAGGRRLPSAEACDDAFAYVSRPRLTDPKRVIGAKPAPFCYWLFDLLGARPGDSFVDLFPGSGGVSRAWQVFESRAARRDVSRSSTRDTSRAAGADA